MINNINPKIIEILNHEARIVKNGKQSCIDSKKENLNQYKESKDDSDTFSEVFMKTYSKITKKSNK